MKLPRRQFLRLGAGAAALPAIGRVACAETYPARPIRLVVPFPPGGAFDTLARPWVEQVKPLLGTVIVENIGGGGSSLGAAAVARARPGSAPPGLIVSVVSPRQSQLHWWRQRERRTRGHPVPPQDHNQAQPAPRARPAPAPLGSSRVLQLALDLAPLGVVTQTASIQA